MRVTERKRKEGETSPRSGECSSNKLPPLKSECEAEGSISGKAAARKKTEGREDERNGAAAPRGHLKPNDYVGRGPLAGSASGVIFALTRCCHTIAHPLAVLGTSKSRLCTL